MLTTPSRRAILARCRPTLAAGPDDGGMRPPPTRETPHMSRKLLHTLTLLPALLILAGLNTSRACANTLDEAVESVSESVRRYLAERGEDGIAIGPISGPKTGTGRLIETRLTEALKDKGIKILDEFDAKWELRGSFKVDPSGNFPFVGLNVMLFDSNGAELSAFRERFNQETAEARQAVNSTNTPTGAPAGSDAGQITTGVPITESTAVAVLAGATTDLQSAVQETTNDSVTAPVGDTQTPSLPDKAKARAARDAELKDAIANPTFHVVSPTAIAASDTSPFHVEILAAETPGNPFRRLNIEKDGEDRAFVPLTEGNQYGVHVINTAAFDVGVELLIDGINTLEFAEDSLNRETGKWVIAAGSSGFIKGWYVNPNHIDTFVVVPDQQGVAATLGRPQQIGTITATIYPAFEGDQAPAFEQLLAAGNESRGGTGKGAAEGFQGALLKRHYGTQPLAIISVHYNNPVPPIDLPGDTLPE